MKRLINLKLSGHTIVVKMDGKGSGEIDTDLKDKSAGSGRYNSAIDGLESLILAHACSGVDVSHPKYIEGIQTALEAIAENT